MTYGEKAVGLTFNPSQDPDVDHVGGQSHHLASRLRTSPCFGEAAAGQFSAPQPSFGGGFLKGQGK